jgi:RNA polymerase sigma factor (TIGR02999 family)
MAAADATGPAQRDDRQEAAPRTDGPGNTEHFEAVYTQLRAAAQQQMAGERPGHTLGATALVHEAYLRMSGAGIRWSSRGAFYKAAAEAMRRILIEHARKKGAAKRGGDWIRAAANLESIVAEDPGHILALDEAILRLEKEDPRAAEVVRLRFYAGLTVDEAADAMDISRRTLLREWEYARAWLLDDLKRQET